MDKNILKIDLDIKNKQEAINVLRERISYCHDIKIFSIDMMQSISLVKKSSYGALITLNRDIPEGMIIIFQLLFGSDYMKEANTYLNHFILEMNYSNRLFTCKRYPNGEIKKASIKDITKEIKQYVTSKKRKNYHN